MRLFTFGHGYTAAALTRLLVPQGWQVTGTVRSAEGLAAVEAAGARGLVWPGSDLAAGLAAASHVLVSVPPSAAGDPVLAAFGAALAASPPRWLGYLSTTGVYGDHGGGWVDEETPLNPATERGRLRVEAEAAWQASGLGPHIFRLAGIYGPGRGPFEKLRQGTARRIIKPGQVFSRTHVDDIAMVIAASMAAPVPGGRVYNVCDDDPAPPDEIIAHAARLIGMEPPPPEPFETAQMTPMAKSFYAESKRVSNRRIKEELGIHLAYPDYRAVLAAMLDEERRQPE